MAKTSIVLFILLFSTNTFAQDYPLTDSLKRNLEQSKTNKEKIKWLRDLASFYINLNTPLSDAYAKQQLEIAELSRDRTLMLEALLSNAYRYYSNPKSQDYINRGNSFTQRALTLAKASNNDEYLAWTYTYLAWGARIEGEKNKALNYNTLALSIVASVDNDSLKISALRSIGDTYLSRNEELLAFRNYIQALNLAEEVQNYDQMRRCYYMMANFYSDLEDFEKAKDYLFKSEKLALQRREPYHRLNLYNNIGRIYTRDKQYDMATSFYEKCMSLSDSLQFEIYKINSYSFIVNQFLDSHQEEKALRYLEERKELREFMIKGGFDHFLNQSYAKAYTGMGRYDSANFYFKKALPFFETKADKQNRYLFYNEYANYFFKKGEYRTALDYWLKTKKLSDETGDIEMLQTVTSRLDSVYQKLGDFKNAYYYNSKYNHYKDSLETLSTEKDLLLLEVDNENKRKEKEILAAEQEKRERHNIQYMGITAAIAGVFIVLVMLGIFSVSKSTIRILGFFAFIFLFEFIILIADNQIHHWTHGEPWKILAIKIGLISILLPLHHFLEEKVIHYLTTRKMMEVTPKSLFAKLSGSIKQGE